MKLLFNKIKNYIFQQRIIIWAMPIVAIVLVFRQVFTGYIFNNGDVIFNLLNYFIYYFRDGNLIGQEILSGFPVLSSVAAIWYYPINNLFSFLFGEVYAYSILNLVNLLLTYILSFLFFRRIKLSFYSSVFSSVVFVFSGQLMLWVGLLTNTNYYFILPLGLYLVHKINENIGFKKLFFLLFLGFVLGVSWLSSHVQYTFYIHSFIFIYWFLLVIKQIRWGFIVKLYEPLLVFSISFFVGYQQIQAILDIRSVSARQEGVGLADFWAGAFLPQDFIHYIFPFFKIPFMPFSNPNLYVGILPLFLLLFVFLFWREIKDFYFKVFLWSLVGCLLLSIKYSPFGFILHNLPFFDSFREAPRIMFIGNFALAAVAGFVLDYIIKNPEVTYLKINNWLNWCKKIFLSVFLTIVSLLTAAEIFFKQIIIEKISTYFLEHKYSETSQLPIEHYLQIISDSVNSIFTQTTLAHPAIIIFIFFGILAYVVFRRMNTFSKDEFFQIVILVTTLNFVVVYWNYYTYISVEDYRKEPQILSTIKNTKDQDLFRTYSIFPGQTRFREIEVGCRNTDPNESFLLSREMLLPNINMDFGVDALAGYDNFMPRRISELLDMVGSEQSVTGNSVAEASITTEEKIKVIENRKNLLRMMNTRYLISHYPFYDKDFKLVKNWKVGECETSLNLYELNNYWPRYFVTNNVKKYDFVNLDLFVEEIVQIGSNPVIYVEEYTGLVETKNKYYEAVHPLYTYSDMEFDVDIKSDGFLYVGNAYLPKYSAYVNGAETKIYKANYGYMAIFLTKGSHKVVFHYKEPNTLPLINEKH